MWGQFGGVASHLLIGFFLLGLAIVWDREIHQPPSKLSEAMFDESLDEVLLQYHDAILKEKKN